MFFFEIDLLESLILASPEVVKVIFEFTEDWQFNLFGSNN